MEAEAGAVNYYHCGRCGCYFGTVHKDAGVTPMFLPCHATRGCKGTARSMMYADPPKGLGLPEPAWEWYKPSRRALRRFTAQTRDHVNRGGVLLRPLGQKGPA